jgi:hypothetical protein
MICNAKELRKPQRNSPAPVRRRPPAPNNPGFSLDAPSIFIIKGVSDLLIHDTNTVQAGFLDANLTANGRKTPEI